MDVRTVAGRLAGRARTALARRFGVDPRALAALRISLGLLLLADLALRSRHLVAFYTDAGVLPRALLREQFPAFATVSLHAMSGSAWAQVGLFVVAGAAALALLAGYRTTLATAVSFALVVSLHARNPIVLNAGDSVLRRLLFWSVFLPLGGRWSVDALRERAGSARSRSARVASIASAALLVQVVLVYATNALFKLRGENWLSGEAARYALGLDSLTILLGDVLGQFPAMLGALDLFWIALLATSPLLLALTGWPRAVFAGLFVGMHLGMAFSLRLGVFPFVSTAGLLVFLPPRFWDAAERGAAR
ncbi:HTTM domain-containing protein, partial [Halorussus litoreus]|uniref:HTTM domain-containing protein n=1 Tax=Halorussus litoreus TaxID=1710536 RepID=UPI0018E56C56